VGVRYWKGSYDEDLARERERRKWQDEAAGDEQSEMWIFRVLVAVQVAAAILAGFLFMSSR
jgi:hypothetical protein